jgi:rhamnogalacturonyl hydrolase YesR
MSRAVCAALVISVLVRVTAQVPAGPAAPSQPMTGRPPLEVARVLAARYPAEPAMSYIPALAWSGSFRLAAMTGEDRWREKPRRQMQPFVTGAVPAIAEPYRIALLAGHLAFADAATLDENAAAGALAQKAADFMLATEPDGWPVRFDQQWTDDMFMASSLLSRLAASTRNPAYPSYIAAVQRMLTLSAERLQRPDGLYNHAANAPHAWGRGNGFAAMAVAEALSYLPIRNTADQLQRSRLLEINRKHLAAMLRYQEPDGVWRQVVDDPSSYKEMTVTALTVSAMARGVARGWLDGAVYTDAIERGWRAVTARVHDDGTVRDVCTGTGAGPTREHYLTRPVVNGADDRGGAMALLAALEIETYRR